MDKFTNDQGMPILVCMVRAIQNNKDYLSEIDGQIGDGDHGINMNKGFTLFYEKIKDTNCPFDEGLSILGKTLLMEIGGSMGPLYGKFFISLAKQVKNDIDKNVFLEMLDAGIKSIQTIGNAKPGDKSLIDTLVPAQLAYKNAIEKDDSFCDALVELKSAAHAGMLSTKELVAKIGRASRLGERSKGYLDAGATSCNILLQTMADGILELLNQ